MSSSSATARRERLPVEERRRQIIEAAAGLFRDELYGEVSLEEIASEAGVTRGLITHHFGTKRELYVAVVESLMRFGEIPVPEYRHGQSLAERLDSSVEGWLDLLDENREMAIASVNAQSQGDPQIAWIIERARQDILQRVADVMGVGPLESLPDHDIAYLRICIAASEEAVLQWLQHERLSRQEVHGLVLELFEEGAKRLLLTS